MVNGYAREAWTMTITPKMLDELLEGCERPEDLLGERGLLRQYFPNGTDLSLHGTDELEAVAGALNSRPGETLGWRTPAEALAALL